MTNDAPNGDYYTMTETWRQQMDAQLRTSDGWLSIVGLDWLNVGENRVGSAPDNDVVLPAPVPPQLGVITFADNVATLSVTADVEVTVDDVPVKSVVLQDDFHPKGATVARIGDVRFHVIKRGEQYGVRIRDANSESLQTFGGRAWFPVDTAYRVTAKFTRHETSRMLEVENSIGKTAQLENPGYIDFEIDGFTQQLQAFSVSEDRLWFIFRDATSGNQTYGAGRFLYAPLSEDGVVDLDFNRAFHPPCSFTPFATCPLPPRENVLAVAIPVGERFP